MDVGGLRALLSAVRDRNIEVCGPDPKMTGLCGRWGESRPIQATLVWN